MQVKELEKKKTFIKKEKENKKQNEKVVNRKLGKVGNLGSLGNLEKVIPSFLISEFSILSYSQNRKLGFKNLRKKFLIFPRFPSFRPALDRGFRVFELAQINLGKICCMTKPFRHSKI